MTNVILINPKNGLHLFLKGGSLVDSIGNIFPIKNGVPIIADLDNYAENFGVQWNKFDRTQLDSQMEGLSLSRNRFFAEMGCNQDDLSGKNILEVGSGAGRFSKVVLDHTQANLYSVDYSDAVSANYKNNGKIAPERFHLFQASIYEMPFTSNSFDKVFCFGVLQHTPNFEASIKALIDKAKPGSEIVVDFYQINGWWTKIHSKYLLRPFTKKMNHQKLFSIIESNIDWMIALSDLLNSIGLKSFTRLLPITDIRGFPISLTHKQRREWAILDTFDAFSPEFDNPQRMNKVVKMFEVNGADVIFSGMVNFDGGRAAVVRAVKRMKDDSEIS